MGVSRKVPDGYAFIIEQLKEREDERRHNFERPVLQLPIVDDADAEPSEWKKSQRRRESSFSSFSSAELLRLAYR